MLVKATDRPLRHLSDASFDVMQDLNAVLQNSDITRKQGGLKRPVPQSVGARGSLVLATTVKR